MYFGSSLVPGITYAQTCEQDEKCASGIYNQLKIDLSSILFDLEIY